MKLGEIAVRTSDGGKVVITVRKDPPSVTGLRVAQVVETTGEPLEEPRPVAKCRRPASGTFAMGTVIALADRLAKRSA